MEKRSAQTTKSKQSELKRSKKIGGEALKKKRGQKYYDKISRKGGKAVKKKYGSEYFADLRMKRGRRFPPCPLPSPADLEKGYSRHRFDPATGICHGCGLDRNASANQLYNSLK